MAALKTCATAVLITAGLVVAAQAVLPAQPAIDASVKDVLQQYSAALASLDADAVKKVQPSIDVASLKKAFGEMKALQVDIDTVKVLSSEGGMTRVSCRVTQTLTPKAGSKKTSTVTRVLRLKKQDTAWVIDSFER